MNDMKLSVIVEAIDRITAPFQRMGEAVGLLAKAARRSFDELSNGLARLQSGFAGIAATIGAGFELREIIRDQDAFARIGTDAGVGAERVDELRKALYAATGDIGAPLDQLTLGFRKMFEQTDNIDRAQADIGALATAIQRVNGHGEELGSLFGTLERLGGLQGPQDMTRAMAMLREQIGPNADYMAQFASFAPSLLADYETKFNATGLAGLGDIAALFGALRPIEHRPGQAASAIGELLSKIDTLGTAQALQYDFGVPVLGRSMQEAQVNTEADRRRPLREWLPQLLALSKSKDALQVGQIIGPDLRDLLAKLQTADVAAKLSATGDVAKYLREAAKNAETLAAAFEKLKASLNRVTEYVIGPLKAVTWLLQNLPTVTTGVVIAVAGFSIFGVAAGWVKSLADAIPLVTSAGWQFIKWMVAAPAFIYEFVTALTLGFTALESLELAFAANPLGAIILAIGTVAAISYEVYEHWDKIEAIWNRLSSVAPTGPSLFTDEDTARARVDNMLGPGAYDRIDAENARLFGPKLPQQQSAQSSKSEVTVRFENLPRGARVTTKSDGGTNLMTNMGIQMAVP